MAHKAVGFRGYTYQKFKDRELCSILDIDPLAQPPLFIGSLV